MAQPSPIRAPLRSASLIFLVGAAFGALAFWLSSIYSLTTIPSAEAAGGEVKSPTGTAPDRYAYYPGTEALAKDEIRVVACGTGMPAARRGQAASCFLIEVGNGDKFLFDIGTGSMANVASLMIPYQYLDKVFLSHLHTDHMGDLLGLWAGGWTAGRPNALRIWGPSGATPEMGTAYAMDHFLKFVNWDKVTREYKISPIPGQLEVTEFDYAIPDQVVYQNNGVTIRSYPAVHIGDGPVSYKLEYAGLSVFFSGDTVPNRWFIEHGKDVDLAIHESMHTPEQFVQLYNQPPQLGWRTCCEFHTSPQAFGKIMSAIQPRHAVAYHFFNEPATRYQIYQGIRDTYDGPLSMATDMMVWNITKDGIEERMAVSTDDAWSVPGTAQQPPPVKGKPNPLSESINVGRWRPAFEAQDPALDKYMERHNLQKEDWRPKMYEQMQQEEQ
ncbi:guanitoxin biosynthesis MBL fold metallo-hydrolase GntH [Microbulbifer agarilyticus]|uniref:guanitoxin biosynthesis MBL fold metallo-hydrolase GntH n=1 Tax=Microbulbifer agarilyticus TaxID=260552 RepID=UPI001CD35A1C|nr:guanitoxin biosynthesis MBL fold metallo-hydrolase GntH [Microbulbifer agarilyticus]MCA0899455.1 MBL fold metallo-hydrolase [Microbulbifer agarilyticus]